MNFTDLFKAAFYFKGALAAIHLSCTITFSRGSLVSGMHILKKVCYMTTSFTAIHFFYEAIHMSRKLSLFHNIFCNHPLRKKVEEKKLKEYVYLRKTIVALLFERWLFIPQNKLQ